MCVYVCVCVCVYIYIYIHHMHVVIYTRTNTNTDDEETWSHYCSDLFLKLMTWCREGACRRARVHLTCSKISMRRWRAAFWASSSAICCPCDTYHREIVRGSQLLKMQAYVQVFFFLSSCSSRRVETDVHSGATKLTSVRQPRESWSTNMRIAQICSWSSPVSAMNTSFAHARTPRLRG